MAYHRKKERNIKIVEARKDGKTFTEIAKEHNINRRTACDVYHREVRRELSTAD